VDEKVWEAKVSLEWEWGAGVGVREAKESKGNRRVEGHWAGALGGEESK